ncbi:MAG: YggS family pyridoxal phosphate-dependent enzyme [Candidatus Eremiobacteraeota bacterium]|nr:YggS family pyridoxal phosphate-dependent enzyme [Candidatus Eremiobacteraeota bacterium]
MQLDVRERYERLLAELAEVTREAGRSPADVTVVAVTKKQSAESVRAAINAGLHDVGENYVQEARAKFDLVREGHADLGARAHFIGHLQTNKAKAVAQTFDLVQSVDRLEAGQALARAASALGKTLPVLVQVNISPSERFGCAPMEAERLAEALRAQDGLVVQGIMAIGPVDGGASALAGAFALAAKTFERVGGNTLSIGMSGDWREAVRCGSTMIRIGTALFGPREVPTVLGR